MMTHGRSFSLAYTELPNIVRVRNCLLGAKDNYQADRNFVDTLRQRFPAVGKQAALMASFKMHCVSDLAEKGITQFIEIGSGVPDFEDTHRAAQRECRDARMLYVSADPLALRHRQALSCSETVDAMYGDPFQPDGLIEKVRSHGLLDLYRPVAVVMVDVLEYLPDPPERAAVGIQDVMDALAPGSCLIAAHAGVHPDPSVSEWIEAAYRPWTPYRLRTGDQFRDLLTGLKIRSLFEFPGDLPERPGPAEWEYSAFGAIAEKLAP